MEERIDTPLSQAAAMRKANQHWEMAGLARQDLDYEDEKRHTELAKHYEAIARGEA